MGTLMKTPVIDLKDLLSILHLNRDAITKDFKAVMSPEQIKQRTIEAITSSRGESAVAFKEIIDSIKLEAYHNGQLAILQHLAMVVEQTIKNFEEAQNVTTPAE